MKNQFLVLDELAAEKAKKSRSARDSISLAKKNLFDKTKKSCHKTADNSDSDTEDDGSVMLVSDSDCSKISDHQDLIEGDFVVVNIHGVKGNKHRYIARIDMIDGDEIEGVFLKKISGVRAADGKQAFIINHDDEASFDKIDIIKKLPAPKNLSGSLRKANQWVFPCDLSKLNIY